MKINKECKKQIIFFLLSIVSYKIVGTYTGILKNNFFLSSILSVIIFFGIYFLLKKGWSYESKKEKKLYLFSFILSLFLVFTTIIGYNLTVEEVSYLEKGKTYFHILCLLPLGVSLFTLLFKTLENLSTPKKEEKTWLDTYFFSSPKKCFLLSSIVIFCAWFIIFLAFYPGIFSYDASVQLNEVLRHILSNNNPFLHTVLMGNIIKLGHHVFGNYNAGIALYSLFQMIIMSLIFAYVIFYLQKREAPKWLKITSLLLFAFLPTHSMFSITATKDVLFAGVFTLLVIKIYDMIRDTKNYFKSPWQIISTIFIILCMFILRHNGYYAFCFFLPFAFIGLRKYWKQLLCIVLVSMGGYKIYLHALTTYLHLTPEAFPSAVLCVPLQQIARTYTMSDNLTEEEKSLLEQLIKGPYNYNATKVDSVIWYFQPNIFKDNIKTYTKVYIKLGLRNPILYIDAFLANTIGYWYLGDKLPDTKTYRTYIEVRTRDDHSNTNGEIKFASKIPPLFSYYYDLTENASYQQNPMLAILMNTPLYIWLFIICIAFSFYKKQWQNLIPFSILFGLLGTIFLGPVAIMRYAYPFITLAPILLLITLTTSKKNL